MSMFDQAAFNDFVIRNGVVGFFKEQVAFKSGRLANDYINWRTLAEDAYLLDQLTDFIIAFVQGLGLQPQCFYGVPEGGTKLGILTQYKWAKQQKDFKAGAYPLAMGRGKPKDHGMEKDRFFLGFPKGKVVILEDTTTTGGTLLSTVDVLQNLNVPILAAIAMANRNERRDDGKTVPEALREKGVQYYSLGQSLDLLPLAYAHLNPGPEVGTMVEKYYEQYGEKPLRLVS